MILSTMLPRASPHYSTTSSLHHHQSDKCSPVLKRCSIMLPSYLPSTSMDWTDAWTGLDNATFTYRSSIPSPQHTTHHGNNNTVTVNPPDILPNTPSDHLLPSKPDYRSHLLIPRGVLSLKLGEWRTQTVASLTCFLELPSRSRVASKLHNTHSVTISKHGNKMYVSSTTISQVIYGNHSTTYQ